MKIAKLAQKSLIALSINSIANLGYGFELLSNQEMESVQGQASSSLFNAEYIAPQSGINGGNVGFYRLGLQAEIEMNANIKALRLGCDGAADGTSNCDIDISNLRITGLGGTSAANSGPPTDFKLTNPFFEFAIRNPTVASQREILGIRFGAYEALGRMTMGENPSTTNIWDDTGITRFSGDMNPIITGAYLPNVIACTTGTTGNPPTGCAFLSIQINAPATLDPYDYKALHGGSPLILNGKSVPYGTEQTMLFDGLTGTASAIGISLPLNSNLTEQMHFIHDLAVADKNTTTGLYTEPVKDFSMSVQKEAITWQKVSTGSFAGAVAAQKGWWMSIPQVVVENLVVDQTIYVSLLDAFGTVNLSRVDLAQRPADNCYGSLTFC